MLDLFLLKEQLPPGVVFDVENTAGNGDVDMRVLIALPAVGVERAEDTLRGTQRSMERVAQRNRSLSRGQLLLKNRQLHMRVVQLSHPLRVSRL